MWTCACLPPDYDIAEDVNHNIVVDELQAVPATGLVPDVVQGCDPLEFRVRQAVSDPDGDDLFGYWRVNDLGFADGGNGALEYELDLCLDSRLQEGGLNEVRAYVMDRAAEIDTPPTPAEGGDSAELVWVFELTLGNCFECL